MVKFSRVWSMPSHHTFTIKPIRDLLLRYDTAEWCDPFAGDNSPAGITNDLNPAKRATHHMDALDFTASLPDNLPGVLFDPPYSLRQIKECYNSIGHSLTFDQSKDATFGQVKDTLAKKMRMGATAICFGWNSSGFGINRGFTLREIMLVCHGGHHNDTIVTVEEKTSHQMELI